MGIVSKVMCMAIRWYQRSISAGRGRVCKYQPTCSAYCLKAIEVHGVFKGTILASWRILRCNPWSKGGVDWVPPKGEWPKRPLNYEELLEYRRLHDHESQETE